MSTFGSVEAVAFDAYGTLFDVHSVVEACNHYFPGKGGQISQIWRTKQLEYSWLTSLIGRYETFWSITERALVMACKSLGLDLSADVKSALLDKYLVLDTYPEVSDALERMTDKKLVVLSNGSPDMLKSAVEGAGLGARLTSIISADDARIFKPSPRVYGLAPDRLGIDIGKIVFVSSNSWDIVGASAFGFQTCWVNRLNAPMEELDESPNLVVSTLFELSDALDS